MIIPFQELRKHEFSLSDINVMCQRPIYRILTQKSRLTNGFLYLQQGSFRYSFDEGEFVASEGGVVYLPLGSRHRLDILSKEICFYRVDFTVRIDGEIALFSNHPIKITDQAPPECIEAITALEGDYGIGEDTVMKMQKMCAIFSALQKKELNRNTARLMPAVRYLQENASGSVNCATLADLCFLSTSRFYDLFHAEFGMTPLEYRDRLLLRRAVTLLSADDLSISEAAFAVGFENAAYFSRFFKKHMGISPTEYKKQKE